ncbi:MAG TPA: VWA domain-containing protein [Pseudomonadota bacterium]|jgi:Mg-chelatase subunit ChlD|nr:VWA domain-containing protein [Pseudomonadota bacterium]HNN52031.1 VWA domain-containing protein [Pseudomonadota bacterium]
MTDTTKPASPTPSVDLQNRQQALLWRLVAACFGQGEKAQNLEALSKEIAKEVDVPDLVLDPMVSITTLTQRFPELRKDFETPLPGAMLDDESPGGVALTSANPDGSGNAAADSASDKDRLRRTLVLSKLLLNAFGPQTQTKTVTAQQYSQWTQDLGRLEEAFGYPQGGLRGRGGGGAGGAGGTGPGGGRRLLSEDDLRRGFQNLESELVRRMELREVLKDSRLASKLSPSIALVEQLLADKANLSGVALENAKKLIRAYVDQLADVLKLQVQKASKGKLDRSIPPKRVFRNLDLKKTLWKNLTNWNPDEQRLYVDRLTYRRTANKTTPTRLIVVVDQSGSMVDAMVQSTILASIFAGLPKVEVHLVAFDTRVLDLTPWVHDPFEVLLRTELGGGTYIRLALIEAAKKIVEPKNTAMVLISDFYEGGSDQELLDFIKGLKDSGVHFIPVGALQSSGYFSVSEFFRTRLAELGMPILHGAVNKLIHQLRYLLN